MSAFINPYLGKFSTAMSFGLLRRLQGEFELRLAELLDERRQTRTVRELFDSAQVVQMLREAVDHCRCLIRAKRRRTGWPEYLRPPVATEPGNHPTLRVQIGARPRHGASAPGRPSADSVPAMAGRQAMGHGWPARSRAGSAAAATGRSGNAGEGAPEQVPPT